MFSHWLNKHFCGNIDPIHGHVDYTSDSGRPMHDEDEYYATQPRGSGASVVLDAQDRVRAIDESHIVTSEKLAHPNIIGNIRVDDPVRSATNLKVDTDQEYINEMTTLLRRLNGMLEDCPQGVSVMIELREPTVMIGDPRPTPRICGTVGKKL